MFKNPKIAFMTTLGVNVGDEFIREGICSFLDEIFENWTPFYVNKVDLRTLHDRVEDESAVLEDKFRDADIIIQAGAPVYWKIGDSTSYNVEWAEELWRKRIFKLGPEKPILNIAAGACQPYPDFAKTFLSDPLCVKFAEDVAQACRWTSVRDPLASQTLYALGIDHDVLPCTAFHAARKLKHPIEKAGYIGINFMPLGGHFKLRDDIDGNAWEQQIQEVLQDLRNRHRLLFIAHDLAEKKFMERFRVGEEGMFYSTDYRDYLSIYGSCTALIANRVHGAVCAAGFGRPAIIIGNDTRLQIGDYIGLSSRYVGKVTPEEIVYLLEKGIKGQAQEQERLLTLREESAARYRNAIKESLCEYKGSNISGDVCRKKGLMVQKKVCLASVAELTSLKFKDFMTTINCFAQQWGLRQITEWSKVWEYPWLWFNGLSEINWSTAKLLDIGSEISPLPWFLASLGAEVTLVECDDKWVSIWEHIRKETGLSVNWHIVDGEELPFNDNSFDVVTSFSVIEHQQNKKMAVDEVARVLKPSGIFALSFDICEPDMGMTFPEWNGRALTMAEFEEIFRNHPEFNNGGQKPEWNIEDMPEFIKWHLQSAPHHNYAVGAAILKKSINLNEKIKKILIPRFDTIGDIILVEGFLEALLKKYAEAEIVLVVQEAYLQLKPLFPERIKWITTKAHPYREPDITELNGLLNRLAEEHWDIILTTTFNRTYIDESIALKLKDVRNIAIGSEKEIAQWLKDMWKTMGLNAASLNYEFIPVEEFSHEIEKYKEFWERLTGESSIPNPHLIISESLASQAQHLLSKVGLEDGSFCICAPAGIANVRIKAWPEERFADVIVWLEKEYNLKTLVTGHEKENEIVEKVVTLSKAKGVSPLIWLGKDGDIPLLAALFQKAKLYVGNDTGPMHIAASVGIPVVGIFGGGHWPRFSPIGQQSIGVAGELPCFSCNWDCIFGDAPCVRLVSVEDVQSAIKTVIQGNKIQDHVMRASNKISIETSQYIRKFQDELKAVKADRNAKDDVIKRIIDELKAVKDELKAVKADQAAKEVVIARLSQELAKFKALGWGIVEVVWRIKRQLQEHNEKGKKTYIEAAGKATTKESGNSSSSMVHVAIDAMQIQFSISGGVEVYMKTLVRALISEADRVKVTLLCTSDQLAHLKSLFGDQVRYHNFSSAPMLSIFTKLRNFIQGGGKSPSVYDVNASFSRLKEEIGIDILHSPAQIFSRMDFNVPAVLNLHDLQHLHYPENFSLEDLEARKRLYGQSAALATAIIASSEFVRQDIINLMGIPSSKVYTIPVAFDPDIKEGLNSFTPEQAKKLYNLPDNFAFYPAQFWKHKNHVRLIQALAIARTRSSKYDLKLVLTGYRGHSGWPLVEQALDKYDMKAHVWFLDFIPSEHLGAIYRLAAFCIMPSLFEASSYPVIEAQSLGCPAMCANITSLPDLMADNAGLLFDPFSPEDMAEKMLRWIDNPSERHAYAERGRQRALRNHSLEAYSSNILNLYNIIKRG